MRQACNVAYTLQSDSRSGVEREKWLLELERPPPGWLDDRRRIRDRVDPGLLDMMRGAGANA